MAYIWLRLLISFLASNHYSIFQHYGNLPRRCEFPVCSIKSTQVTKSSEHILYSWGWGFIDLSAKQLKWDIFVILINWLKKHCKEMAERIYEYKYGDHEDMVLLLQPRTHSNYG